MSNRIAKRRGVIGHPVQTDMFETQRGHFAHQFAINEAQHQMVERAHNALMVNPFPCSFFQKLLVGRRCSCFSAGHDAPDGFCVSCFKTGVVGGYEKFGCRTHMVEATSNLSLVNVLPDYESKKVPTPLTLLPKSLRGSIFATVKLDPNVGVLDLFRPDYYEPKGTKVLILIKTPPESDYVDASCDNIQSRLQAGVLQFRIELSRRSPDTKLPYLKAIRLRYQTQKCVLVPFNVPLGDASINLQDQGIWEQFTALTFFTDNTIKNITADDWIYETRHGTRWRFTSVKKGDPMGVTSSWFMQSRLVQPHDSISEFYL